MVWHHAGLSLGVTVATGTVHRPPRYIP